MTNPRHRDKIIQIVPPERCFKCDVCCRFPEQDSFLAPYFTQDEITSALAYVQGTAYVSGTELNSVPNTRGGCKITLVPHEEGFICPEFNTDTAHCKIYDARPLDCKIYPFAIMRSKDGSEIVLGVDMKCPYVSEFINSDTLMEALIEMRNTMDSPLVLDIIIDNPGLIGPYQDDVIHAVVLTNVTKAMARLRRDSIVHGSRFREQN